MTNSWGELPDAANRAAENGGAQLGYDQTLGVDPQDPNRVYLGFQELYLSTDGGASFADPQLNANALFPFGDNNNIVQAPEGDGPANPCPTPGGIGAFYLGFAGNNTTPSGSASQPSPVNSGQGIIGVQG